MTIDKETKKYITIAGAAVGVAFVIFQKMNKKKNYTAIIITTALGLIIATIGVWGAVYAVKTDNVMQQEQQKSLFVDEKVDQALIIGRENKNNISDVDKDIAELKTSYNSIGLQLTRIDDKLDLMSTHYLTKEDANRWMERTETSNKESYNRLGNVMYNDRQELRAEIKSNEAVNSNFRQYMIPLLNDYKTRAKIKLNE